MGDPVVDKGMEIFRLMEGAAPSIFDRKRWAGQALESAMRDPDLKVRLFRFVDVFPTLTTPDLVARHVREYFLSGDSPIPPFLRPLFSGSVTGLAAGVTASILRKNILEFAGNFIAGDSPEDALPVLRRIRDEGRTVTLDILGETAVSEAEAEGYRDRYLALVGDLAGEMAGWNPRDPGREARFPRLNVSVKISSLYSRIGPVNHEDSVVRVKERLRPIFRKIRDAGGFVNLDMEMVAWKQITFDVYTGLLEEEEFRGWDGAGLALQAYLKDAATDLERLIGWARELGGRVTIRLGDLPGEDNRYFYRPKGVGVVIAPWNFPFAISMGMVSAALVTGNAVLYKPSSLSAVNGWLVFSILREAGVPEGVLQFVPGRGGTVGGDLVTHRDTAFVLFTGSRTVGLSIVERAGRTVPGQRGVKKVVAEMGGKNAVVVDADADLDLAVAGVVRSAFGYQGQKCSACSRAIVHESCYDRFLSRLVGAVRGIPVGPPEDPANFLGPVIDASAKERIERYVETGRREGSVAVEIPVPGRGYYVSPVVLTDLPGESRVLREEIFGPVLSVVRARDFDEALAAANDSDYALTGGLFSRSPANIARARKEFEVGNLYINRGITGAIVGRQPFGGFRMSGVGSKAGGFDYLLQFLEPRVVTENTMRRGFSPDVTS